MGWNVWQVIPPLSKEQKKKWEEIPTNIFWIKIIVLLTIVGAIGVLLATVINM